MAIWGIPIINAPSFTQGATTASLGVLIGHSSFERFPTPWPQ
jgi:hypothetical protein